MNRTDENRSEADPNDYMGGCFARRLIPIFLIIVGFSVFSLFGLDEYLSFSLMRENRFVIINWYEENKIVAILAFWITYAVAVAFSLPGAVWLTLICGFVISTFSAMLVVITSATIGSVVVFLAARYAFAEFFHAKAGAFLHKMESGFRDNAFWYLLFLRLVPVFPFWLVNLVPAFLGISMRTYILATFIGIIPGSFLYCSLGSELGTLLESGEAPNLATIFKPEFSIPLILLAFLSLFPIAYKKYKASKIS